MRSQSNMSGSGSPARFVHLAGLRQTGTALWLTAILPVLQADEHALVELLASSPNLPRHLCAPVYITAAYMLCVVQGDVEALVDEVVASPARSPRPENMMQEAEQSPTAHARQARSFHIQLATCSCLPLCQLPAPYK